MSAWVEIDALKARTRADAERSRRLLATAERYRRAWNLVWRHFRRLPIEFVLAVLTSGYEDGERLTSIQKHVPNGEHQELLAAADWLLEHGFTIRMQAPENEHGVRWRKMSPEESAAIRALERVTFSAASFDKRFFRSLREQSRGERVISVRQAALLQKLVTRHRRQIRASELPTSWRPLLAKGAA